MYIGSFISFKMGGVISNLIACNVYKMVIAVEYGLEDLSGELRARGYTIVSYPEYLGVVDAFIYKDKISNSLGAYENTVAGLSLENYVDSKPRGVLIINAKNKNLAEIEEVLRTRVYSPLF